MTIDNKDGEKQPEDSTQNRRTFLKKMGYVAPAVATYKIGDVWADDDDDDNNANKNANKNAKKNSPDPGLKKKSRVDDDD